MKELQPVPANPGPKYGFWKIAGYFVALALFAQLTGVVFRALQGSASLQGFAKINQVITTALDVTGNRDDTIVTVWSLILTFILVLPIGWVYSITKAREGYDQSLVQTLIVMGMVVCGMMMLIQDQFSRALALVGVVSAVRFRTNVKDPKDAVYVLISIAIGMGAGLQVPRVAAWLTLIMCMTFLLLSRLRLGERSGHDASFVDLEPEKKKKKKKKKDKERDADVSEGVESGGDERYERIADGIKDPARGVKRPNAVLVVHALEADAVANYVRDALEARGIGWHLVATAPGAGETRLEYLIRFAGSEPELTALGNEVEAACGSTVGSIEVRDLAGAKRAKADADVTTA